MKKLMTVVLVASAAFAAEGYHVLNKIKIGGTGGWDYVTVDSNAHRLYATHGTVVEQWAIEQRHRLRCENPG
jgi:hypothetical protein